MSNLKENIKAAQIDLIKDLGIDKLEPTQKEKLLTQIGEILQQRIVLRIVEELPEGKQDEFQTILEKSQDDPTLLDKFLEENIPGVEGLILAEIGEYKKSATDFMSQSLGENAGEKLASEEQSEALVVESAEPEESKEVATPSIPTELSEPVVKEEEILEKVKQVELKEVENKIENEVELKKDKIESRKIEPVEIAPEPIEEKKDELATGGFEKEQAEQEAQILEENKVENSQVAGEELDLSNEIEEMTPIENEKDKQ